MKLLLTTLNSKYVHSNLALRYLNASLDNLCHVDVDEFTINENEDEILFHIIKEGYDIVAFSCYIWNIDKILRITNNIKKISPNTVIILGGPEVSYNSEDILRKHQQINYVITGEGEFALRKLIESLILKCDYSKIDGLTFRVSNNEIKNNAYKIIEDMKSIPDPYKSVTAKDIENKIVYYETSRGCIYNCAYCLSSIDKGIRDFPIDKVKLDLKKLVELGAKQIKFVDRTFNFKKERTLDLLKYMKAIDNGIINFHFEITAFTLNDEIISIFEKVRPDLFQLEIGVQSTNKDTLVAVGRVDRLNDIKKWVYEINKNRNIHLHLDLIAGLPNESLNTFKKSFNDTFDMLPDVIQLGFLKVLKGSNMEKMVSHYGINFREETPYEVLFTDDISYLELNYLKEVEDVLEKTYNSGRLKVFIEYLYKNYYSRNPFEIFEDLYNTLVEKKIEKKRDWEYIVGYYLSERFDESDALKDILKFEYLNFHKGGTIPQIFKSEPNAGKEVAFELLRDEQLVKELALDGLYFKEVCKNAKWEIFKYDIIEMINNNKLIEQNNIMFFNFKEYDYSKRTYLLSRRSYDIEC